ncbi:MAG: chromosomal replication initiator protein DnaA [Bacteroidaceae bacterium]|nr:chromosomal replication initiator protein DnaA [Bacteroidales bacterium]MBQ2878473.1 chromosomal replication initiator protein DnaA [Bacteroidaceae bacterium]MBQ3187928.1 chromosomal replication initiator protein DnaA [Bacteroidaceae bacterium]MBQ3622367.1 chromosomal replication initiator protein DnaA [Bacteroidaceae bacterium]
MNSHLQAKWDKCLDIIRDNVSKVVFDMWFADIKPLRYEDNTLTIQVKSNFVYEFLEENFADILGYTLKKVMGEGTQLMYSIIADKENDLSVELEAENKPTAVEELDSMLINKYTFDNYVEGVSNRLSRSVAMSVADKPGRVFNPLFIHGASGVGKTHLVNAIGCKIKEIHPELRVLYISAHLFQVQYTDSILQKSFNDFMRFYQSIDVLIIDDIQEIAGLQKTQNAFFHIFNHLHLNGKQLIMTSDRSPMQLKGMEERLITRFKWGLTAEIEKPDLELRKNILRSKTHRDGLKFPEEVITYIAEHVDASVRDLEGIVVSMMAHSTINNDEIDINLARRIIGDLSNFEKRPITIDEIIKKVSDFYGVEPNSINTRSRKREVVQVRQVAMFLAKKYLDMSTSKIGQYIGNRDHATVLHACKTITNLAETDKQFRSELNQIEISLQSA